MSKSDVLPHSQLAADDAATAWLQTSHLVRPYLSLAADNVRALDRLIFVGDEMQFPIQAHYPLLRGVIEASARVKWILQPDDRNERIQRSLRARVTERKWDHDLYREMLRAAELYDETPDALLVEGQGQVEEQVTKLNGKIREISDTHGLDWAVTSAGLPTMVSILREVGVAGKVPGEFTATIWRAISGLSHPSASRVVHYSSVEIRSTSDNVHSARITTSMHWTHSAALVSLALMVDALNLYRIRRTKPDAP